MSYWYHDVDSLEGKEKVGTKQCVALLQMFAELPHTSKWKEGAKVIGASNIAKGTAIATFVNGKYESKKTGNHAAFYVSQDLKGMWIMDQWANPKKEKISKRYILRQGKAANGSFIDPSNNADAYSIIE